MSTVDIYVQAAPATTPDRAIKSAIRHFEVEWGSFFARNG